MERDLCLAVVDVSRIVQTGNATHTRAGVPVEKATTLKLMQLAGDGSIYLIHYDNLGNELTDTCHSSVEEALEQAEFEYGITPNQWSFSPETH